MTPEQCFAELLAADPSRPFVTYYDEASGERAELSARSLGNWVAKTHFLLLDELGLGVGDSALLDLPAHWISVPCVLGSLAAGLALTDSPTSAAVAFVRPGASAVEVPDVYTVSPAVAASPDDYISAVRPQPDAWASVRLAATDSDPCLGARSRAEVVEWARARAGELGLESGTRALTTRDWHGPADWLDTLLVPLVVGGSVVYVRNAPSDEVVERRMNQERATIRIA